MNEKLKSFYRGAKNDDFLFSEVHVNAARGLTARQAKHGGCWLDNLLSTFVCLYFIFYYRCHHEPGIIKRPRLSETPERPSGSTPDLDMRHR